MKNFEKYRPGYYMPPEPCMDWVKKDRLTEAPAWCSVDLRDGNQALITPMKAGLLPLPAGRGVQRD